MEPPVRFWNHTLWFFRSQWTPTVFTFVLNTLLPVCFSLASKASLVCKSKVDCETVPTPSPIYELRYRGNDQKTWPLFKMGSQFIIQAPGHVSACWGNFRFLRKVLLTRSFQETRVRRYMIQTLIDWVKLNHYFKWKVRSLTLNFYQVLGNMKQAVFVGNVKS